MGIKKQFKFTIKDIANENEVEFVGISQRRLDNFSVKKIHDFCCNIVIIKTKSIIIIKKSCFMFFI